MKQALVLFSSRVERRFGFAVIAAETEFREERDSHRSQAGGVTPACLGLSLQNGKQTMMRRRTLSRSCLDVRDRVQVRVVKKRLRLTDAQRGDIIRKAGASIPAMGKEAGARKCLSLPRQIATPPAALIAASEPEVAATAPS